MRLVRVLLAILVLATIVVHGQEKRAQSKRDQQSTQTDKGAASPSTSISVVDQATSPEQENRPEQHSQSYLGRLFSPENLPNVGLFFVGLVGVIIAICTLRDVRTQTENAGIAARAAQTSAESLIHGERAWLLVDKVDAPLLVPIEKQQGYRDVGSQGQNANCSFRTGARTAIHPR